jgi:hypothetical protein
MDAPLHPDVEPLAFLLGRWQGEGRGEYPTINSFAYAEELVFEHVGKPFLAFSMRSRDAVDGRPLHAESGYWRALPPAPDDEEDVLARLEVVVAHPVGIAEIHLGAARRLGAGVDIALRADHLLLSPTAKDVRALRWHLHWDGEDTLTERLAMAAVGKPLTHHLSSVLHRA